MSEIAYIALGSNLGDRRGYLERARAEIDAIPGCHVIAASTIEETAPLGGLDQSPYLNQMLAVETNLEPTDLLARFQAIEHAAGRVRSETWGSRTLDIDIVLFGDRTVHEPNLTIPHPGLASRAFWQREIDEVRRRLDNLTTTADE